MMIIMRTNATPQEIAAVVERIEGNGLRAHLSKGEERTVIGAVGDGRPVLKDQFLHLPGVDRVISAKSETERNRVPAVVGRY